MKKAILVFLLLGGLIAGAVFYLRHEEDSQYDEIVSMIADEFETHKELFYTLANTLPEGYSIRGGETSEIPIFVMHYSSFEHFSGEELMEINPALYAAVCDLEKANLLFYRIERYGNYFEFIAESKDFPSFRILRIKRQADLEDILAKYDGYTMLEEREWYIVWLTSCKNAASNAEGGNPDHTFAAQGEELLPASTAVKGSAWKEQHGGDSSLLVLVKLPMEFVTAVACVPQYLIRTCSYDPDNAEPWFDQPRTSEQLDKVIEENLLQTSAEDLNIDFEQDYCLISYGREIKRLIYTDNGNTTDHFPYIVYGNKAADSLAYIYTTPQIALVPSDMDAPMTFTKVDGKYVQFRYERTETGFAIRP